MFNILSLVTSVKDYVEITHKLIETDSAVILKNYSDFGGILTYLILTISESTKDFLANLISLKWLQTIWSLPIIVPDISSAMISEISILDGYFHNAFTFLDTPITSNNTITPLLSNSTNLDQHIFISSLEKFVIGLLNSLFLFLPSSTAHIITLRRFVMQGLEAGFIAGLGTIAGNILWISSVILGLRFLVIPWLSLDIFRYFLGFLLLMKYMWDCYNDSRNGRATVRLPIDPITKKTMTYPLSGLAKENSFFGINNVSLKIFLLNFLLALTEQTCFYPFFTNISMSPESSILETFAYNTIGSENLINFLSIHLSYILGLLLGSLSLLHFSCWFWENPAFKIYMWFISSASSNIRITTSYYYKIINFVFLYLTMICAISSIPYYGLDYFLTNPLGLVSEDRIHNNKQILEFSFLNSKASDKNTRRNQGRHGRRERWKRRVRKYRTFDAALYDQGIYDLFTIEDLNYGFDRFWLRRKMLNHRVRFRFFPGPWMRSFKKQLAKPRLESSNGPRSEFFRILFEQVYHPTFHKSSKNQAKLPYPNEIRGKLFKDPQGSVKDRKYIERHSIPPANNSSKKDLAFDLELQNYLNKSDSFLSQSPIGPRLDLDRTRSVQALPNPTPGTANIWSGEASSNFKSKKPVNTVLRKFIRKFEKRIKTNLIVKGLNNYNLPRGIISARGQPNGNPTHSEREIIDSRPFWSRGQALLGNNKFLIYSKRWKYLLSKEKSNFKYLLDPSNSSVASIIPSLLTSSNNKSLSIYKPGELNLSKKEKQILIKKSAKDHLYLERRQHKSLFNFSPTSSYNAILKSTQEYPSLIKRGLNLLHPIKFYLQKEQAFERKLRYYTPTLFRTFSIENNAPYFRIMMKKYFYHYKPTLRWKRTMKVASMRKARRKTSRLPRKLNTYNLNQKGSGATKINNNFLIGVEAGNLPNPEGKVTSPLNILAVPSGLPIITRLQKPTHSYSIVSKKATRYRYKIYRDVLQHWYYTPFNRLLLKFDVDSFIKRQPYSHFLTKKEENLLHLRRYLLSEHYDTLRWYTYMQHYRSMKNKIGSTKSFASRTYNQQFQGTFKKIRHLFAVTPNQVNKQNINNNDSKTILKFDQLLYNDPTKTKVSDRLSLDRDLIKNVVNPDGTYNLVINNIGNKEYFLEELSKKFFPTPPSLNIDLAKTRIQAVNGSGQRAVRRLDYPTGYPTQVLPSSDGANRQRPRPLAYSLNPPLGEFSSLAKGRVGYFSLKEKSTLPNKSSDFKAMLMTSFLKKYKKHLSDQDFLKNYLTAKIDKLEKRKKQKEKHFKTRLNFLKNKLDSGPMPTTFFIKSLSDSNEGRYTNLPLIYRGGQAPTGLQKAFTLGSKTISITTPKRGSKSSLASDGIFTDSSGTKGLVITNKIKYAILSKINSTPKGEPHIQGGKAKSAMDRGSTSLSSSEAIYNKLTIQKFKNFENLKKEKQIITSIQTLNQIINNKRSFSPDKRRGHKNFKLNIKKPLFKLISNTLAQIKSSSLHIFNNSFRLRPKGAIAPFIKSSAIKKQKRLRKVFKKIKLQKQRQKYKLINKDTNINFYYPEGSARSKLRKDGELSNKLNNLVVSISKGTFVPLDKNKIKLIKRKKKETQNKWTANINYNKLQTPKNNQEGIAESMLNKGYLNMFRGFKRKTSPNRRGNMRRTRARGVIKKRSLDLKKSIFKESSSTSKIDKKFILTSLPLSGSDAPSTHIRRLYRRSKLKKHRFWRTHKRTKYSQKYTKYRKTFLETRKIRVLSKQMQKIQSKIYLQKWWLNNFLPNLQANTNVLWQLEKDKQIQTKLNEMSNYSKQKSRQELPYGSLPGFARLSAVSHGPVRDLLQKEVASSGARQSLAPPTKYLELAIASNKVISPNETGRTAINNMKSKAVNESLNINSIQSLPFYAGWDESLRKFVITNRLLSRREAGYTFKPAVVRATNNDNSSLASRSKVINIEVRSINSLSDTTLYAEQALLSPSQIPNKSSIKDRPLSLIQSASYKRFEKAPLQGMNAATTLYWQIPFTTYDPDQFFALGMDGFSPIGWRRFQFRHTILKNWITNTKKLNNIRNLAALDIGGPSRTLIYTKKDIKQTCTINNEGSSNITKDCNSRVKATLALAPLQGNVEGLQGTEDLLRGDKTLPDNNSNQKILKNIYLINKSLLFPNKRNKSLKNNPLGSEATLGLGSVSFVSGVDSHKINDSTFIQFKNKKNFYRRLKKRYRKVKKHPRPPVWFPSGPLLNQVLPVHYIYVFYKRNRLPKERYLKRRLLKGFSKISKGVAEQPAKAGTPKALIIKEQKRLDLLYPINKNIESIDGPYNKDFTLRRRVKPKRKYHRKSLAQSKTPNQASVLTSQTSNIEPRRFKFLNYNQKVLERPYSSTKKYKEKLGLTGALATRKTKKTNLGDTSNMLRVRQLRRRIQRQIFRPVWRYKPRAGGFVWPGDYLRLELIKAPLLNSILAKETIPSLSHTTTGIQLSKDKVSTKLKRKKKRTIQEWQIQPKKYLLEKHNLKVIKKKLEKANRSYKIRERIKQITLKNNF